MCSHWAVWYTQPVNLMAVPHSLSKYCLLVRSTCNAQLLDNFFFSVHCLLGKLLEGFLLISPHFSDGGGNFKEMF